MGPLSRAAELLFSADPELIEVVAASLKVSLTSTFLATLAGVPLGALLFLKSFPGKNLVRLTVRTLTALPTVVVGLLIYGMIGRQGPLGQWGMLFTPAAIVMGQFILALPIVVYLTHSAVAAADPRMFATCKSFGAGPWRSSVIAIGEMRTGVAAAIIAAFGRVIAEVGVAMMVGGNIKGYTRTMTTAIALETGKGELEFALALGVILLAVAFTVNLALQLLSRGAK